MIEDYLKYASAELDESKVVTNVMSSITFICNGWDINDNDDIKNEIGIKNEEKDNE
jgi:hypothetical protein